MNHAPATNPVAVWLRTPGVRLSDRAQATIMHATARWTVRYGERLRFAGGDLPAPRIVRAPTRYGHVPVHVYRPPDVETAAPVHVHFHGGAWLMRHPGMDDWWCRYLAATTGAVVLNVDFRTGPYVTYPVAQHECHDVAMWAAGGGAGGDGDRLTVGGFSSGGGLAASVCLQARDRGTLRPRLQVLGVPALDVATDLPRDTLGMIAADLRGLVRRVYFPDPATRTEPYASPLLADDLVGLPPAIILTAELDSLRREGHEYAQRLRAAGVPVEHDLTPGVDHYFLTEDPDRARTTMARIATAIVGATLPA